MYYYDTEVVMVLRFDSITGRRFSEGRIKNVDIPASVRMIDKDAFMRSALMKVTFADGS